MRIFHLTAGFVVLTLLLVSGCTTNVQNALEKDNETIEDTLTPPDGNIDEVVQEPPPPPPIPVIEEKKELPEGAVVTLESVEVEKALYHSSELMSFDVIIDSDTALEGVEVKASGIAGRMSITETVDIVEGENVVGMEYKLPSCNTCSGIRPGNHSFDVNIYYGELIDGDKVTVEIRQ